jgi:hypothetical protein
MIRPPFGTSLVLLLAAISCSSPCLDVQSVLCRCAGQTQSERSNCETAAAAQESLSSPDDRARAACETLLPDCEKVVAAGCDGLKTADGKRACGLSLP